MTRSLREAALEYGRRGWKILPLHCVRDGQCSCGDPQCDSPGKHPRTGNGFYDATTDAQQIAAWWRRWPRANIGHRPAQSGHLVLDIDGPAGEAAAQALGALSEPTLTVLTARGRHLYFQHPGGHIGNAELASQLDVRGDAGYVLLPPSVHESGVQYQWVGKLDEVKPLPPPVAAALAARTTGQRGPAPALPDRIPQNRRNATLTSLAGSMRRRGASEAGILAALTIENQRCDPPLKEAELAKIARSVARYPPAESRASQWPAIAARRRWWEPPPGAPA